MRRTTLATAVLALVIAGALVTPGEAARKTSSFEGNCTLSGQLVFDDPIGNLPRETGFTDRASGTCTGSVDGDAAADVPVELRAEGSGSLGCLATHTTSAGTLTLRPTARGPVRIRFWTEVTGALTELVARFGGAVSGEGVAFVDLLPYADQSVTEACQAGTLRGVRYDLVTQTVTPVVG